MKRWTSRTIWEVVENAGGPPDDFPLNAVERIAGQDDFHYHDDATEWVLASEHDAEVEGLREAARVLIGAYMGGDDDALADAINTLEAAGGFTQQGNA